MKVFSVKCLFGILTLISVAVMLPSCSKSPTQPVVQSIEYPTLDWYAGHANEVGRVPLPRMVEIINQAYAAYPDSAIGPVRAFIWKSLQAAPRQARGQLDEESYSLFDLTWQETLLLIGEPWFGPPTNTCRNLAIAEANAQWAGYAQFQDKADAFRHAYWNILMCRRINEDWARKYSSAHESDLRNGLLDAQMDLNNNGIGRALWRSAGWSKSESQYSSLVKTWQYVKVSDFNGAKTYLIYLKG